MSRLDASSWGKSSVRVSKIHRHGNRHEFTELTVNVQLTGKVQAAYLDADNAGVLPTDTVRNTTYALAHEHLGSDVEDFARTLARHFLGKDGISGASVELSGARWERHGPTGFIGGTSERRTVRLSITDEGEELWAGIAGLVVLKTTDSAFLGFPRDEYTTLAETDDRILATTVEAEWRYEPAPDDPTATWEEIRQKLLDGFFGGWSASVQHQGWQMADLVLEAVPEVAEISFRLPNQHHLGYDLGRFGVSDDNRVFQPTSEPFGDIRFRVVR